MVELTEAQKARRAVLIQNRGQLKGRITRLTNYLEKSGVYADPSMIDRHLVKIDEELNNLANIEHELTTLEPNVNHSEESENIRFDYEDMQVLIRKFKEPNREATIMGQTSSAERTSSSTSCAKPTDYLSSLPKVEVKKFDGKLENFRPYRDWFRKFIHDREGLSDSQRFDYFKRTLTGEAEKMISAFQTTDENYAVAWDLFDSTYNVEYILVFRHCDLLYDTPVMKNSSPEEIRKLINHIQTQILAMKALGEKVENWNTLISHIIMRRMDKDTEREWNRSKQATINSRLNGYARTLSFLTVPMIGKLFPMQSINRNNLGIPKHLQLADPTFDQPAPVDILLSVGTTLASICQGQIQLNGPDDPDLILQETRFGWIIGGSKLSANSPTEKYPVQTYITSIETELKNFWEMDDFQTTKHWSKEEQACEEHFKKHITRDVNGRYIVALPFNGKEADLGNSRESARKRFKSLLRKFQRNPELEKQYTAVMQEYIDLGHMSETLEDAQAEKGFYLPHHAVVKETSLTTKVRVVFDGSAKGENSLSLNDTLMVGPTIQDDIFSLLTRFLTHQYVITADIEKMYRQFYVREEDRKYQRIWWKDTDGNEKIFQLNIVTFGLSSAPYLAIRCVHQLADDESLEFPNASNILKRNSYVDDFLSGADTFEEALQLRDEVTALLQKGQLNLRQWASNDPRLLYGLPEESVNLKLNMSHDSTIKTLGLHWDSARDAIVYTVKPIPITAKVTKRTMLSEVSKIFDPLGFLGPVIIKGRMILHRLWIEKLGWDDAIPLSILTEWRTYASQLIDLNDLSFDRKVIISEATEIQLHGFCDASLKGYGACIYLRSTDIQGKTQTRLLCSKYRVAPIKPPVIARLELCSALLLSDLYVAVKQAITYELHRIIFWSDSMIALHWIKTSPHKLLVFVANRVAGIQKKTDGAEWRHVRTKDNPADHISRGLFPSEFTDELNWKFGPAWLSENEDTWPKSELTILPEIPEMRKTQCLLTDSENVKETETTSEIKPAEKVKKANCDIPYILRYSSIGHLRRLFAIGLRFKNKLKGPLSAFELIQANYQIIKVLQESTFSVEMKEIRKNKRLPHNHRLRKLDLFLGKDGLLRVAGRLKKASIPYDQKHPMLIPKGHHVTTLLIRNEHLTNHHSGVQTTLYALRRKYWLVDGRHQVRKVIQNCVTCIRANPPKSDYMMSNLSTARVTEAKPFSNVGVDYCGPFYVKEKKHRNRNRVKVWVAVFVCFVVKAVHLEVVTDLTTEGFIAALKRFVARRGKPRNIHSDNGSNFIGASNEIKELYSFLQSKEHNDKIHKHLADQGITWHFIPPLSPHFGGLWEAGVKSFKHHLKRICDDLVTLEQFNTLVIEIEAILNSRPLTPISTDPNDLIVLTPGHFLTGDSLMSLPEPDFSETPDNRLSAWELIQKKQQEFWRRWYKEYLNEQTLRQKWNQGSHDIQDGTVVILREDNLPPRQWSLGRVIQVYPGSDGTVRIVKVKTAKGELERNVRRLSPLLNDQNNQKDNAKDIK
ncbi:uncharacterized protein LOC107044737 [Diachasma alloeum]|uniref:uncharacterized protein LOC107044737 n=1 Tax=Diachasma alloeum TaxID=454923 RepID=UPI0007382476|nr:uncharacterized protein LOC107044737 [Diachasma alloeum]